MRLHKIRAPCHVGLNLFCQNVPPATSKQRRLKTRNSQQIAYLFMNADVIKPKRESEVDTSMVLK